MKKLIILSLTFIFSLNWIFAQHPVWLGSAFPGPVFSLSLHNNYLFTGSGSMFTVYDITNPQAPINKGHCHTTDCITYISYYNNKCFAGNNAMGIAEINISNPSAPIVERYLYPDRIAGYNPAIDSTLGFFPMGSAGLWALDIGNNDSLPYAQWGTIPSSHDFCIDVVKRDSMLYVTDRNNGIYILKYTNDTLSQFAHYPFSNYMAMECETDTTQHYLYVTGFHVGSLPDSLSLWVFDIHDPSNFQLLGTYKHPPIPSYPLDLKIKNNIAYIAAWGAGIIMVDVSNPLAMHQCGNIATADASNWIEIKDTVAWVADLSAGFKSVNIADTANPILLFKNDTLGDNYGIAKSGNNLYTSIKGKGLEIALNNSGVLTERAFVPQKAKLYAPFINGSLLFLPAWDKGVIVYDISNPEQPDSLTCIKHTGDNGAISVYVSNGQMVVAEATYYFGLWRNCNIYIWDISLLSSPVLLGSTQFLSLLAPYDLPSYNIDRHNNLVALTQWHDGLSGNFYLFDISDPQNISIADTVHYCYPSDVKIFESGVNLYAAVTMGSSMPMVNNGLAIYDITDSTQITECGFYYAGNTGNRISGLDVYNSTYAVTAEGGLNSKGTLRIINISNPNNPFITDSLQIGSNTSNNQVKADGNYIYHSSGSAGLMLFSWDSVLGLVDYSNGAGNMIIFPNPAHDKIQVQSLKFKIQSLEIYNIQGKLVKQILFPQSQIPNEIDVSSLAKGIYLLKIKSEGGAVNKKLVVQ